jgi:hypothetical protein
MKVRMTRSMGASMTKGRILSSNAYQEVYLRPRFGQKKNHQWYDFIDNGERYQSAIAFSWVIQHGILP